MPKYECKLENQGWEQNSIRFLSSVKIDASVGVMKWELKDAVGISRWWDGSHRKHF